MDSTWREAEREWEQDPNPGTLSRLIRARRQAGAPLPMRLLRAQRCEPRAKPDTFFTAWYASPGSSYVETVRGRGGIGAHWIWGLRIERSPAEGEGADEEVLLALAEHRPPGLELWVSNTELLTALRDYGLRYLDLGPRSSWSPAGWQALGALRELQVLVLASVKVPVTDECLTALGELPRLTSLTLKGEITYSTKLAALESSLGKLRGLTHLELDNVTTGSGRDLAQLAELRHLEEFTLHGPLTDDDFARLAELPTLRKVDLWRCEGLTSACLQHLRREPLPELLARDCPGIEVKGGGECPRCGGQIESPAPEKPSPISLPPTGGDYEWVETTSSWSLKCTQCPAKYSGTSRGRHYL